MDKKNLSIIFGAGLVLTAAIWGFAFVVVKDTLDFIGPTWMVAIRFSIAAIFLGIVYIKKTKLINRKIIIHGSILGVFLFSAYLVQTMGCSYTTAGKNAFLTTFYVILVPIFSWPILKKKPHLHVLFAAILALVGIGLLALNGDSLLSINKGDALTLLCGFLFAIHIIFSAIYVRDDDLIWLTFFQFLASGILGFILSPIFDGEFDLLLLRNSKVVLSLVYLGLFSSLICFLLQTAGLKYVQPALASLFLSLESVFGVLSSCIFLGERLSTRMVVGCILIFSAIILAEVVPRIKNKS